jgi:heat shock protein HslJ
VQSQVMKSSRRIGVAICLAACSRGSSANTDHQPSATPPAAAGTIADTAAPASTASSRLAGTHWRLVEIQSISDKQGATRPDDRAKYTIAFDSGLVSMRLDCNQGAGKYDERPAADDAGSLTIGPLAVTRAFCPPPSLGDRIVRDMAHVRSYRIVNARLALSLMAGGGTYFWEPDPAAR